MVWGLCYSYRMVNDGCVYLATCLSLIWCIINRNIIIKALLWKHFRITLICTIEKTLGKILGQEVMMFFKVYMFWKVLITASCYGITKGSTLIIIYIYIYTSIKCLCDIILNVMTMQSQFLFDVAATVEL